MSSQIKTNWTFISLVNIFSKAFSGKNNNSKFTFIFKLFIQFMMLNFHHDYRDYHNINFVSTVAIAPGVTSLDAHREGL